MKTAAGLVEQAKQATGLGETGGDGFMEGLERLVASAKAEARLNLAGEAMFEGQAVMLLSSRLQIEDWYGRHPEIDDQQIVAPLMVLGMPRTGSTALHCILAEDPAVRVIRNWEGMSPCPPPIAGEEANDPRIPAMQAIMERRNTITPRMQQMLPSTATSPVEDQMQMGYNFVSQIFQASFHIPSYAQWLHHEADLVPTFQYVKRVLKLLQWRCPPTRWRLKNPTYSMFIDALDTVFPDARYCMTHRDVTKVIPSVADLYYEMHKPNTDTPDKAWMGEINCEFAELGMRRMMAFRDAGHDHRFFDFHFADFQRDPFPSLERLYAWLGEDFTPEARMRMEAWRKDTPRDKHGVHEYHPEEFGLDLDVIRARMRFYSDRFGEPVGA
ncbi:MAG: sulfotransferase [Sphingomonadales bacterium]|nr:sulfotransferase [Sphingomonadales bacterium]